MATSEYKKGEMRLICHVVEDGTACPGRRQFQSTLSGGQPVLWPQVQRMTDLQEAKSSNPLTPGKRAVWDLNFPLFKEQISLQWTDLKLKTSACQAEFMREKKLCLRNPSWPLVEVIGAQ
jgi:hypothetical protein